MTIQIRAHAKINPFLWVGPLRTDGYHEIDTIFQAVDLHDLLTFRSAEIWSVRCSDPMLDGDANLVTKALRLCSEIVDVSPFEVYIEKHIPSQAGLGGGSSDAGAALRVLAHLSRGALDSHLPEIAAACGSDVPFFIGASARARATGRGEQLEPLPVEPIRSLVLAKPNNVSCDTASAYARLDRLQIDASIRPETMPYNDFERVAPCESLELINRMKALGANEVGLCGSGSAVFGFTDDADAIRMRLESEGYWAVSTQTINSFGEMWTQ